MKVKKLKIENCDGEDSFIEKNNGNENVTIPDDCVVVLDGDNYVIYTKIDYASKLVSD